MHLINYLALQFNMMLGSRHLVSVALEFGKKNGNHLIRFEEIIEPWGELGTRHGTVLDNFVLYDINY